MSTAVFYDTPYDGIYLVVDYDFLEITVSLHREGERSRLDGIKEERVDQCYIGYNAEGKVVHLTVRINEAAQKELGLQSEYIEKRYSDDVLTP